MPMTYPMMALRKGLDVIRCTSFHILKNRFFKILGLDILPNRVLKFLQCQKERSKVTLQGFFFPVSQIVVLMHLKQFAYFRVVKITPFLRKR